jgi:uncharacterized protein YciW
MDRDYLRRRLRSEQRLAWRATTDAAVEAHRQLAAHYEARLAELGEEEPRRPWFRRLWAWAGSREAVD